MKTHCFILALSLFFCLKAYCQDIEQVAKAQPVKVTGRLGMGSSYISSSKVAYHNNLGYYFRAGLNFNFFGFLSVPLSFSYSDRQTTFSRPSFKNFGLSPRYKWITIHGGYRSYRLSPYVLSGTNIIGGGIDLRPGIFRLSAFYGKMAKLYDYGYNDPLFAGQNINYYDRKMYGGKIGLEKGSNKFILSFLKAGDNRITGDTIPLDTFGIRPKENLAVSLTTSVNLFKVLTIAGEVAGSILNEDAEARPIEIEERFAGLSKALMPINLSTRNYWAYNGKISLTLGRTQLGLSYEHVDPHYASLGVTYLQSDINNYTFDLSTTTLQSKLNFSGSLGVQFSNSKNYFANTERRIIYYVSTQYRPGKQFNLSLNYNNFNTSNQSKIQEFLDSFYIATANTGLSGQIQFALNDSPSAGRFSLSASHNKFKLIRGDSLLSNNISASYGIGYHRRFKSSGISYGLSANMMTFENTRKVRRIGGSVKLGKRTKSKLSARLKLSYFLNATDGVSDGNFWMIRPALSYALFKKGRLGLTLSYKKRNSKLLTPFSTTSGSINYNMTLAGKKQRL